MLRLNAYGTWTRLIVDDGWRVSQRGTNLLIVSQPATVSFVARPWHWWGGSVVASAPLRVTVNWPRRPHWIFVNGSKTKFAYDESARTITFDVGAGNSTVEAG